MTTYLWYTYQLMQTFSAYRISQILRSKNSHIDALERLASAVDSSLGRNIHVKLLDAPITQMLVVRNIDHIATWMDPIFQFLKNQTLHANPIEARRVRYCSTW